MPVDRLDYTDYKIEKYSATRIWITNTFNVKVENPNLLLAWRLTLYFTFTFSGNIYLELSTLKNLTV